MFLLLQRQWLAWCLFSVGVQSVGKQIIFSKFCVFQDFQDRPIEMFTCCLDSFLLPLSTLSTFVFCLCCCCSASPVFRQARFGLRQEGCCRFGPQQLFPTVSQAGLGASLDAGEGERSTGSSLSSDTPDQPALFHTQKSEEGTDEYSGVVCARWVPNIKKAAALVRAQTLFNAHHWLFSGGIALEGSHCP